MKILFVGNSYLYRGNDGSRDLSPYGMFHDLAEAGGHQIEVDSSFIGGSALETHWRDTTGDQARVKLNTGDFDLAIFQGTFGDEPDTSTGHSAENFDLYADLFAELAADNGTESLFFASWTPDYLISISGGDQIADEVHADNLAAAQRNDAYYAPTGLSHSAAHTALTDRYGNGDDGQTAEGLLTDGAVHANDTGAYLAAATLYSTIFNEIAPSSWKPNSLSGSDAALMRQIAWDTVRSDGIAIEDGGSTPAPTPTPTPTPTPSSGNGIIDGRYFDDTNGDGSFSGEPGVGGQTISLLNSNGQVVATTTSANSGFYRFSDLAGGTYRVLFEETSGRDFITRSPGTGSDAFSDIVTIRGSGDGLSGLITIGGNERRDRVDAGLEDSSSPTPPAPSGGNGVIDGRYFDDTNGDGSFDGEPGIAGQTISLLNGSGQIVATTTSGNSGFYRFTDLDGGTYRVRFEEVNGRDFVFGSPGTGQDKQSDIVSLHGSGDGLSGSFTIGGNERRDRVDAGLSEGDSTPPQGGGGSDSDRPDASDATLRGSSSGETITGTDGADIIFGFNGNDRIDGRSGGDFIHGGGGRDTLNGQNGNDTFVFDDNDASINGGNGVDRFVFGNGRVDLTDTTVSSVEIFDFTGNENPNIVNIGHSQLRQARDSDLRIISDADDIIRIESRFDIVQTGSTTRDGERFDVYRVGESSWSSTFLISEDTTLEIL